MSDKPTRRAVDLAILLQVAKGNNRSAFYAARNAFEARHGSVRQSRDGVLSVAEFERLQFKHALTYERVQRRAVDEIREILENYSDRRRAASRHDPPPEPTP